MDKETEVLKTVEKEEDLLLSILHNCYLSLKKTERNTIVIKRFVGILLFLFFVMFCYFVMPTIMNPATY
jgi:hypothetical protein